MLFKKNGREGGEKKAPASPKRRRKRILGGAAGLLLLAAAFIVFYGSTGSRITGREMPLAEQAVASGNYRAAISGFKKVVRGDPKNETAYVGLCKAYTGLQDPVSAVKALEAGLKVLPDSQQLKTRLAPLLKSCGADALAGGKYSGAAAYFAEWAKISPGSAEAFLGLSEAYKGSGDTDKAITALNGALSADRTDENTYLALAALYAGKGDKTSALKALKKGYAETGSGAILQKYTGLVRWDGSSAPAFDGGSGTGTDPYLIYTAEQLSLFRDLVNGGKTGLCATLLADIDLNGIEWTPIGLVSEGYNGVFDGGGWSVRNVTVTRVSDEIASPSTSGSLRGSGFFGIIGASGRVKCLNLSGTISGGITESGASGVYIGSLAGVCGGAVGECFSTCKISGLSVENDDYIGIGGLVGLCLDKGAIRNCYNVGTMSASLTSTGAAKQYIGGICGYVRGTVENCYSAIPIRVSSNSDRVRTGGVTGVITSDNAVKNSYFDASVSGKALRVTGSSKSRMSSSDPAGSAALASEALKAPDFASRLGDAFRPDGGNVNGGYPLLAVMTYGEMSGWSGWFDDEIAGQQARSAVYDALYPTELVNKDLTKDITRVEFAALAVRLYEAMSGTQVPPAGSGPFTDTDSDAVLRAYALGITNGTGGTQFSPYSSISREELAAMLTRVYKKLYVSGWSLAADSSFPLYGGGVPRFSDDGDISLFAKDAVYFMVSRGIVKGVSEDSFAPRNLTAAEAVSGYASATREQALAMSVRCYDNLKK